MIFGNIFQKVLCPTDIDSYINHILDFGPRLQPQQITTDKRSVIECHIDTYVIFPILFQRVCLVEGK